MMNGMGGGMMWGMGLIWIVVIVVLVLAGAALAKYLFSAR
jgi:ABC-type antimicrobial peptide transport system permease subunit